jgi:hypothetical protein
MIPRLRLIGRFEKRNQQRIRLLFSLLPDHLQVFKPGLVWTVRSGRDFLRPESVSGK